MAGSGYLGGVYTKVFKNALVAMVVLLLSLSDVERCNIFKQFKFLVLNAERGKKR